MAPKIITVIGSLNMDLVTVTPRVPSGGETLTGSSFATGPGGKGANQAVACARLSRPNPNNYPTSTTPSNISVKMIGAVGADTFGPTLLASLQSSQIDTSSIATIQNQSTGVAVILVESSTGENRIVLAPGSNHSLQPQDFLSPSSLGDPLPSLIILQLEIPLPTVLQIIKTAKSAGVPVLLNPAPAVELPEEVFKGLDHLIVNESEATILTARKVEEVEREGFVWDVIGEEFLGRGVKSVVVTLGSKGAFYATQTDKGYVPAEKVANVVDTTAAGDTFVGAYAVQVVEGKGSDMREVLTRACKAAGRTVEKEGAQSAIPWIDEVDGPKNS